MYNCKGEGLSLVTLSWLRGESLILNCLKYLFPSPDDKMELKALDVLQGFQQEYFIAKNTTRPHACQPSFALMSRMQYPGFHQEIPIRYRETVKPRELFWIQTLLSTASCHGETTSWNEDWQFNFLKYWKRKDICHDGYWLPQADCNRLWGSLQLKKLILFFPLIYLSFSIWVSMFFRIYSMAILFPYCFSVCLKSLLCMDFKNLPV